MKLAFSSRRQGPHAPAVRLRPLALVAALVAAWPAVQAAPAVAHWTVTDLGTLGGNGSAGYGINNAGQATGFANTSSGATRAFLYSNGALTDLGTLGTGSGPYTSTGNGINSAGQVTGYATTNSGYSHAFLYSHGTLTDLGTLGGFTSVGEAINSAGQVTGYANTSSSYTHAFLYSNGAMTDLGTLGGNTSSGYGINSAGQVTGYASTSSGATHAFLYSNGAMTDLGAASDSFSTGVAINQSGQVAGYASTSSGATHAFLYSNGYRSDLGTLGGVSSYGSGVNDAGLVVGYAYTSGNAALHAFLYSNGALQDLNSFNGIAGSGLTLARAAGINDAGQITGTATNNHAYIATLDTVVWEASSGGSWDATTGWSAGINPNNNTAVFIDPTRSLTVTGPSGAVTVKSLDIGGDATGNNGIATLDLAGGVLTVLGSAGSYTTVSAKGVLSGDGTITGLVNNLGTVSATNLTLAGGLNNSGTLTGNGRLTGAVTNLSGGTVQVDAAQRLNLIGNATNAGGGTVDLSGGGDLQVTGTLTNQPGGRVLLSNGSRLGTTAGLLNSGQVLASYGTASVFGTVSTTSGGNIILSGNSNTVFYDPVEVQAGGELRVSAGSTATFFGLVSQRTGATFSGTGVSYYEGGLHVGASPGFGLNAGDVNFGAGNTYFEDIGGTTACSLTCGTDDAVKNSSYGKYVVNGHLSFGGVLKLSSWQGFIGQAGESFDLFDWGSASGTFTSIDASGLQLAAGTALDTSKLYATGEIDVVAAPVPEPPSCTLMLAGLGVFGWLAAKRRPA